MKYNEIQIGLKEKLQHKITKQDIEKFVELTGDDNKLHVDEEFARKTHFKKPVVHGMLGASFISTIIGTKLPGDGALWFSQSLVFLLPVRIGDNLTIVAEVIKKNDKEKIIELKTDIYNQNKQIVTKGFSKIKIIEEEKHTVISKDMILKRKKVALVVGGTGGIGSAVCKQLAEDGFDLVVHYNNDINKVNKLKSELKKFKSKVIVQKADVLKEDDIKCLIEKGIRAYGDIDVIVNCAAITIPNIRIQNLEWDDFLKQIEINIKSTFMIIKEVMPYMIKNGYGKVINVGSMAVDKPNTEWVHYITAKSALVGLTKSLAIELAPKGIRVNIVTPSLLNTELTSDIPEKVKLLTAAQTPLRRLSNVQDVAYAVSFLASEKSDFITGENIRVNGGQIMI
ncbi:MAG: SDR family oxidoreductase [Ignavibacteria bacterium]